MTITTCVFDAYGTLFDVSAAAREAAQTPQGAALSDHWAQIAQDWRAKQLEYSWLRAVAGVHCDFWQVTQDGLDWALERAGLDDPDLREVLLGLYERLSCYPEVPALLRDLKARGLRIAILSNGSPTMLAQAVDAAGISGSLARVISIEDVGTFKPARAVYDLVGQAFGTAPDQVLFTSSNGWDAAAAADYGFRTAWVNRNGAPQDRLWATPHHTLPDLSRLTEVL